MDSFTVVLWACSLIMFWLSIYHYLNDRITGWVAVIGSAPLFALIFGAIIVVQQIQ